jgi:hypothetical protein
MPKARPGTGRHEKRSGAAGWKLGRSGATREFPSSIPSGGPASSLHRVLPRTNRPESFPDSSSVEPGWWVAGAESLPPAARYGVQMIW